MVSRITKQKRLLQAIIDNQQSFFSAEDIHGLAKQQDEKIGIATVYRFLNEQVEQGVLHGYICDRRKVYSRKKTHCHFIDEETGNMTHFDIDSIDFLKNKVSGSISSIHIEVKGRGDI